MEFNGSCLKQDKVPFNHAKIVNIYIVYEIDKNINIGHYPTLEKKFLGAVNLTKNTDIVKYKYYSRYEIEFDRHGSFWLPGIGLGRIVMLFGVGMSSSTKIDNRKKDIFILSKDPTQGLEQRLSAEKI